MFELEKDLYKLPEDTKDTKWLFIKPGIQERGTECGERGECSLGFERISLEDSGECYYFNIPGNVKEDSGERPRRFPGMFKKIPGN